MQRLNPFTAYTSFVRSNPGLVQNAERLLHWVVWNPERFSSSEFAYEAFNAAVGLWGIVNASILQEEEDSTPAGRWSLWLAAVEQVQMLVELRGMALEQQGRMSRYSPLVVVELIKLLLRLQVWAASGSTLVVEAPAPADQQQAHQEQQLRELLEALVRLRHRYCEPPPPDAGAGGASGGGDTSPSAAAAAGKGGLGMLDVPLPRPEDVAAANAVRAAAIAPGRPPAACARDVSAVPLSPGELALPGPHQQQQQQAAASHQPGHSSRLAAGGEQPQLGQEPDSTTTTSSSSGRLGEPSGAWSAAGGGTVSTSATTAAAGPGALPGSIVPCGTGAHPQPQQQPGWGDTMHQPQPTPGSSSSNSWWWQRPWGLLQPKDQLQEAGSTRPPTAAPSRAISFNAWAGRGTRGSSSSSSARGPAVDTPGGGSSSSSSSGRGSAGMRSSSSSWHLDCREQLIGSKVISTGELVHLLRPLVYVLLLRRYGLASWRPWAVSLGLELLSMYNIATGKRILEEGCSRRWPGGSTLYSLALLRSLGSSKWKASEQHELLMRRLQLVKYFIRSPAYDTVTRPQLERVLRGVGWVPLMGQLSGFAFNLIEGMQRYYSYVEP